MADLLSTIGVKCGYAAETTAGTKPSAFTLLHGIKSLPGLDISTDSIDVSCIDDAIKKYAKGMSDTGGTYDMTFGINEDVLDEVDAMKTASDTADAAGKAIWFEIQFPALTDAFFLRLAIGTIGAPQIDLASAAEIKVPSIIKSYEGRSVAVTPTASE